MPDAKGFFPEDHPQYIGIYWGPVSSPGCAAVMDRADVILAAGPVFSDYTTAGWTGEPPAEKMINVSARDVRFTDAEYTNVAMADFLAGLAKNVHGNDATLTEFHRIATAPAELAARDGDASAQLTRAELWHQIEEDLDPKSTLLCEGGDSWLSGAFTRLPGGARFEIEMQWGSLGWACPASFGYAMGLEADRRLVSVIGDGSFQMTAQEVANMIRHGQETMIFLVNNRGYVSESAIHDGPYNYFKNWDYAGLIDAWNADDGHGLGLTAATGGELADAISKARKHKGGPVLIECQIAHDDCSPQLIEWGARVGRANTRQHPPAPDHLIQTWAALDRAIKMARRRARPASVAENHSRHGWWETTMRDVAGWRGPAGPWIRNQKESVMRGASVSIEKRSLAYSEDVARASRNTEFGDPRPC
jgi:pyruvate decarboxylase